MKKISFVLVWTFLYICGAVYLTLPSPTIGDLPEALVSNEPGDTWQNKDTKAFFTDWKREQIITYYRESFRLKIGGYLLPNLRLNYRPEDTGTYVRKHIDSYYLEEIVIPFRESVFINGWEPKNSPAMARLSDEEKKTIIIVVDGREFQSKITLKWYQSERKHRIIAWTATMIVLPLTLMMFFKTLEQLFLAIFNFFKTKK